MNWMKRPPVPGVRRQTARAARDRGVAGRVCAGAASRPPSDAPSLPASPCAERVESSGAVVERVAPWRGSRLVGAERPPWPSGEEPCVCRSWRTASPVWPAWRSCARPAGVALSSVSWLGPWPWTCCWLWAGLSPWPWLWVLVVVAYCVPSGFSRPRWLTLAAKCRIIRCLSQSLRSISTSARRS